LRVLAMRCRFSYNLVLYKHGELLYNGVCETVAAHLHEERAKVVLQPDELLLATLRQTYERHTVNMRMVKDILMYMVRRCILQPVRQRRNLRATVIACPLPP